MGRLCAIFFLVSTEALVPSSSSSSRRRSVGRGAGPFFEVAKNGAIGLWLFGGLVPALGAVNVFAAKKFAAAPPEDFVRTLTKTDAMPLASLGAPDVVSESEVLAVLSRLERRAPAFEPLAAALGGGAGGGGPLYLSKAAFRKWSKGLAVGDAALEGVFDAWAGGSGVAAQTKVDASLDAWKTSTGFDVNAVDRAIFLGRATILSGLLGLAAIDAVVLLALAFALREAGLF
mmetsp:Transcript_107/g.389  ORF Transcript_107/g.389 Transcript_107/m.389 type:complete len:231 (+) Transcript_107:44-736(+)